MVVDACAIVSIMLEEDTAQAYQDALLVADDPVTSPLAAWEATIILARPDHLNCSFLQAHAVVLEWLDMRGISLVETVSPRELLANAVAVAERHGIAKRALSNFDCFHYAYARTLGTLLLTMDEKLRETDVPILPG